MNKEINITIENGVKELVVRHGSAPDIVQPVPVRLVGVISTAANYYLTRKHLIDADLAVVTFDRKRLSIELDCNPAFELTPVVLGKMEKSDELSLFSINSQKTYTQAEFVKLVRMNRRYFKNREEADSLLLALSNFRFQAHIDAQNNVADNRGNKSSLFNKQVDTNNLPNSIVLSLPLFKNAQPVDIVVEIVLDVAENTARFWLESVDLDVLIQQEIDTVFSESRQVFENTGIVIVNC